MSTAHLLVALDCRRRTHSCCTSRALDLPQSSIPTFAKPESGKRSKTLTSERRHEIRNCDIVGGKCHEQDEQYHPFPIETVSLVAVTSTTIITVPPPPRSLEGLEGTIGHRRSVLWEQCPALSRTRGQCSNRERILYKTEEYT